MAINTLLFDFDGVFRHFDPSFASNCEAEFGLKQNVIVDTAFEGDRYSLVASGKMTKKEWITQTGNLIGSAEAADKVLSHVGTLDTAMVRLVKDLTETGYKVSLLTNSPSSIHQEIKNFGLEKLFKNIFATHQIGFAKPDNKIYQYVCQKLGVDSSEIFFTDDLEENVVAANNIGMHAKLFTNQSDLEAHLVKVLR